MKAYRLFSDGMRFEDVPEPQARNGGVVLKVAGAGLCHSDLSVEQLALSGKLPWTTPFTLGHEIAGWLDGTAYAVYCAWGCGECAACRRDSPNYCADSTRLHGPGLGVDGGMAPYVAIPDRRYLIPLGDLDPVEAAPLADAGLTAYHAIRRSQALLGEGSRALLIGVGGLGHMGIQILKALSPARIVAVDSNPAKLALARKLGADEAVSSGDPLRERFDAVFDFVGSQDTVEIAQRAVLPGGDVQIVGLGGGALGVKQRAIAYGARVSITFYGSLNDLHETIALAREGKIRARVTRYPLERAGDAVQALRDGTLDGRAVLVP